MKKIVIVLASVLAITLAAALPNSQIPDQKKNNNFEYDIKSPGILDLTAKGKLYETPSSRLEGTANYQKNFIDRSQIYGGGLKYHHDPSDLAAGVSVQRHDNLGTNVQGEITRTLLKDRFTNIQGGLSYGQTFNTPFENTEPQFGAFVRGTF